MKKLIGLCRYEDVTLDYMAQLYAEGYEIVPDADGLTVKIFKEEETCETE